MTKAEETDKIAAEIYSLVALGEDAVFPFTMEDFRKEDKKDCKAFYRKIARWHMRKVWAVRQIEKLKEE